MKKRRLRVVTIAAILAALFGSGGGTAWGQTVPDCNNDFGAGESATLSSSTIAMGSIGRITLGTAQNLVLYATNKASAGYIDTKYSPCYASAGHSPIYPTWTLPNGCGVIPGAHVVPGSSSGNLAIQQYEYRRAGGSETHIQFTGGNLIEIEHFNFTPIPWYYRQTTFTYGPCYDSCTDGGTPPQGTTATGECASVHSQTGPHLGGYEDGHITVHAGTRISLTGKGSTPIGIRNTAGNTVYPHTSVSSGGDATASKLDLPINANPYTLQVKKLFDATSFNNGGNITGLSTLANQAVLGLWTGVNENSQTSADGGTYLIGDATQFQDKLTLNSGTNGGTLANYYYHTNTEQRPGGWSNESITTTDAVPHDVNISGTSGGTHITFNLNGTGDMTIENTQCAALNFNGKFAPTIGGDGALRINPTTWNLVSPMRLTHLTVFSPTNLPNPMSASTRGFTHFTEDVDLNFTTKTGFLLLEGGKITFDKKYTYNRGAVGTEG